MGAPIGNQFWKLRSKHGRDTLFATPELLWEAAQEYFQWCIDNPFLKMEQNRNSKAEKDEQGEYHWPNALIGIPTAKPFTMTGLRLYLGCSQAFFTNFKHSLRNKLVDNETAPIGNLSDQQVTISENNFSEKDKVQAQDFLNIITQIEDIIYTQKFEGATVGAYNANIIARDLGLREGIDQQVTGNIHLSKEPTVFE